MKGLLAAIGFLVFFSSCKEDGVKLAMPSTFVKYFSDGQQDEAVDVLETSDKGYLILTHSDSSHLSGGIIITKTDFGGNALWEKSFTKSKYDYVPSNVVAMKDNSGIDQSYIVVGTVKHWTFGARLFVLRINSNGDLKDSISYYSNSLGNANNYRQQNGGKYVIGKGVAQSSNSTNDFFVVGQVVNQDLVTPAPPDDQGKGGDMFFAQIRGNAPLDTATVFTRTYGAGTSVLATRLYLNYTQTSAYWGGTRIDDQGSHMRLVNAYFNSQGTHFDLPYPTGQSGFVGNDFTPYGYGFSLVGNDVDKTQIVLISVNDGGQEVRPAITLPSDKSSIIRITGNSVCSTLDGGLIVLGTNAVDAQGTNTDYYLTKLDATGAPTWERTHGGKYPDEGVRVLQSSDGGYVVLGTTTLANVKTVFLMKTDSQGNIQ